MSNKLKNLARDAGVQYIDNGNGHITLIGIKTVSYWPESKKRTAYVLGEKSSRRRVSESTAIDIAEGVVK